MDFSIMVFAVIALVGVAIGWLFASYQHAQQKAEQLAEREEMVAELSAAKQQITQSEHWRAECELLNNEVRSLQSILVLALDCVGYYSGIIIVKFGRRANSCTNSTVHTTI